MKEFSSIKEFHEVVKAGSFDLRQWFHELLTLIKKDDLNAWISVISEEKLDEYLDALFDGDKDLPLWGVPFAIKDNIDLEQMPTTAACREYSYVPQKSAYAVDLLIKAGAIPLGKTNMDQFATGLVGVRSPYGVCHNSINKDYVSGGSSSGSAVSVATGQVLFSLGTDTAGSGRVPAAFNNI
ncbi:MAG: amidase family protein, partial [Succinivibrio sp.]